MTTTQPSSETACLDDRQAANLAQNKQEAPAEASSEEDTTRPQASLSPPLSATWGQCPLGMFLVGGGYLITEKAFCSCLSRDYVRALVLQVR